MSNPAMQGARIVEWLRRGDHPSQMFTTQQAAQASGYIPTHASSALTSLIKQDRFGIRRTRPGVFIYSPAADSGTSVKGATVADPFVSQRVIQYMQNHPNQKLSINDLVEAVSALRSSVSNALRDASENPLTGIVKITRGLYEFVPSATPFQPVQSAQPSVPVPSQVFPNGVSPGPMAGKTHTELRGLTTQQRQPVLVRERAPQRRPAVQPTPAYQPQESQEEFQIGDRLECVGTGTGVGTVVRSETGTLYRLAEL